MESARSPVEFVRAMEQLKVRSGLTYRQLADNAAEQGLPLPRSTIADALRRQSLPRMEVVAAFVRACGGGEAEIETWLATWARIARGGTAEPAEPADDVADDAPADTEPPRARRNWSTVGAAAATIVAILVFVVHLLDTSPSRSADEPIRPLSGGPAVAPVTGWVRIHPAQADTLCVGEGHDRTGRYPSEIAALRPCADAEPPRTLLQRAHDDLYRVMWDHPVHGQGCLTVITGGVAANLIEPQDGCKGENSAQLFRLELADSGIPDTYRLRPAETRLCLGVRYDTIAPDTEIAQETCTGGADQSFHIERR
ncbi:XRE family transcriptional regulator [Actinokineospora auranticolor]|uniref:XRE family transcriptional regulator n=1 Tax=Actinokineospora auranticolor TaxID=155976 RepID=UPI0011B00678|nr:XRE family transcriptional regulator [Actinokineospora auranticolor]